MTEKNIWKTQKKISVFVAFIGLLVAIINLISSLFQQDQSLTESLIEPNFSVLIISSCILFFTRNYKIKLIQYVHIGIFLINGTIALLDDHEAFNGIGFMVIIFFLMHRYDFLKKNAQWKLGFFGIYIIAVIEISFLMHDDPLIGHSISYILYLIFFLTILYLCYSDEIQKILYAEKLYKTRVSTLQEERDSLLEKINDHSREIIIKRNRVDELETMIEYKYASVDLKSYNITSKEEQVIRELCLNTSFANKEIGAETGLSEGAVKQHFTRIFKKMNVRSRQQLIEICRGNYLIDPTAAKTI